MTARTAATKQKNLTWDQQCELAKMVTSRIEHEQSLTASRMYWNLAFQGFAIVAFVQALSKDIALPDPARQWVAILVAACGMAVALATFVGTEASASRRKQLRTYWTAALTASGFPEPYSSGWISKSGKWPPRVICSIIAIMWIGLMWVSADISAKYAAQMPAPTKVATRG